MISLNKNLFQLVVGGLLLFLSVFDPQVPLLPNGVGFSALIAFLLVMPISSMSDSPALSRFIYTIYPFIILFFVAFLLICLRVFFNGGINFEFVLSNLKAALLFLSVSFVYFIFFRDYSLSEFFNVIVIAYLFNGIVNYLAGTFPDYFSFLGWFRGEVISDALGNNPYRNSFISGSGYFSIGVAYGLICLLFSFHVVTFKNRSIFCYLALVFAAFTGFVAARTSFFGSGSALLYMIKGGVSRLLCLLAVGTILIGLLLLLPELQMYKLWMLSFFLDFDGSASANYLLEKMYFWPGGSVFLVGSGNVNDGTFVYTDSGYMQDILFGGLFFVIIKLSYLAVFFYRFFNKFPFFVILVCGSIMAFHFKGLFLYNNAQGMAAFYLIYIYMSKLVQNDIPKIEGRIGT